MLYVSSSDHERERQVIDALASAWSCQFARFDYPAAAADYIALRGSSATALVEIKTRTTPRDRYPTYMIDRAKLDTLAELSRPLGLRPLLVVRFTDGLYWIDVTTRDWPTRSGGRTDRNDPADIDEVYDIPTRLLRRVPSEAAG